ncbi:type II CRISPR-associated endonuclease Cas1 [Mycoplasma sp. CSL10137]|uniref:type II CRISPR-associated endonuclease Cas1 n=1 Tax=Mycoplasma sp. CSL10137 TaxID=2813824 RepID=UPI00197BBC56|nr:type II CRISPR-associated endonuclease Cas1 [Mycoplasma sp. CSL10137]MBN4083656.1 type II CRISPR-associated endonuclease Cas1 [Mycoplasma sp. CSL10137]
MKKIIDVSQSEYVSLFLNNLIVKNSQGKITIPTNDIETVIFENTRINISMPLINKLIEQGVNIIFCDHRHLPIAQIIPFSGYFDNKVFNTQINWNYEYKGKTWKHIVELKIINSKNLIKSIIPNSFEVVTKLTEYQKDIKLYDLSNREGHAAKVYFNLLFGKDFKRDKNIAKDFINICLNYGYTVMIAYVSRALVSKGFDNRIGIFHKRFDNNIPLACDIVEPIRCYVDKITYEIIKLQKEDNNINFKDFKKRFFEGLQEHIVVNSKRIKVVDYINLLIKGLLEHKNIKELEIDWISK